MVLFQGVRREWRRICAQPSYWATLFILPLLTILLLFGIIATASINNAPMDIVDLDNSQASRDIVFRLDASATVEVKQRLNNSADALKRAKEKQSFGFLIIPEGYQQALIQGTDVNITAYVNQQSYMLGNLLGNQVLRNIMQQSLKESAVKLMTYGQSSEQASANVYPLQLTRSVFGNSFLNYQSFLLAALLPHVWHVIVMMATVIAIGKEFKDGTVQHWLTTNNQKLLTALTSKLLIPALVLALWICLIDVSIFLLIGQRSASALFSLIGASLITQFSYHCAGLLVVAITHNYRLSLSVAAFYTTPAFAFIGVTFPTFNMNQLSQIWQGLLPMTTLINVQNRILHWQQGFIDIWPALTCVALFALVFGTLGVWFIRPKLSDSTYWYAH